MADKTITQLTATATAASSDEIPIWVAGSAVTRKITKANFMGGAFTGGGTVATGGYTLTVPATGTAALLGTAQTFTGAKTFSGGADFALLTIDSQATLDMPSTGILTMIGTEVSIPAGGNVTVARGIGGLLIIGTTSAARTSIYAINQQVGITVVSEDTAGFSRVAATANHINVTISGSNIVIDNGYATARLVGILYLRNA